MQQRARDRGFTLDSILAVVSPLDMGDCAANENSRNVISAGSMELGKVSIQFTYVRMSAAKMCKASEAEDQLSTIHTSISRYLPTAQAGGQEVDVVVGQIL